MNPTIRNIIGVVIGIVAGSIVNMSLVNLGHSIFPPPSGIDLSNMDGLKKFMPVMQFEDFIFPFLAHALGTLAGAFLAALISSTHKMRMAYIVGFFFFLGGMSMVVMVPPPVWFSFTDLVIAYIPMAWLGGRLGCEIMK
jgi:hypothetical protein